jgi:UDP-N-acetylglucosamine 2-epimerase
MHGECRIVFDHIAALDFAATENCRNNLRNEGIEQRAILSGLPIEVFITKLVF